METVPNETVSIPIMNEQRVRRQLAITGREGLQNLLAAIRRMLDLLLAPFRTIAKVIYKFIPQGEQSGAGTGNGAGPVELGKRPDGDGGMDDVAAGFGVDPDARKDDAVPDVAMNKLLDEVQVSGGGTLELVMTGAPAELQAVMPMLLRHVDQILEAHLPADADEAKLAARLVALAETSESARYAHRIVSRQIGGALKRLVGSEQYMGLSESTVIELVRSGATGEPGQDLGGRSAEEQLLATLQLRDRLERDLAAQAHQMARLIADSAELDEPKEGEPSSQKRLLAKVLQAAEVTRMKLCIHEGIREGGTAALPATWPEMQDELQKALAQLQKAATERAAFVESMPGGAGTAAPVLKGGELSAGAVVDEVKEMSAAPVAVTPAPAVHVPQGPQAAAKAAEMAKVVRVASAGGMFGGQAQVERSAKELAEAAESLDFEMEDEGEQPLVAG